MSHYASKGKLPAIVGGRLNHFLYPVPSYFLHPYRLESYPYDQPHIKIKGRNGSKVRTHHTGVSASHEHDATSAEQTQPATYVRRTRRHAYRRHFPRWPSFLRCGCPAKHRYQNQRSTYQHSCPSGHAPTHASPSHCSNPPAGKHPSSTTDASSGFCPGPYSIAVRHAPWAERGMNVLCR